MYFDQGSHPNPRSTGVGTRTVDLVQRANVHKDLLAD